jgi:hypothetical protein
MAATRETPDSTAITRAARPRTRRPRATAARQALRLCEAELLRFSWEEGSHGQPRTRVVTARAALRAVGVPPPTAAALRNRLRLAPEQEPVVTAAGGPGRIGRTERITRAAAGMPVRHPRLLTRRPGRAEWQLLATWCAQL